MACADPQIEQMPRADLQKLQLELLQKTVRWAAEKSEFYKEKLAGSGVPEIQSLDDVRKLPFTALTDILKRSPFDFLTLPLSGLLRVTQQQQPMELAKMYTANDVAANVAMLGRALVATGINRTSVVGVLGDFSESSILDIQYALENIGATVVPLGITIEQAIGLMDLAGIDTLIGSSQDIMQFIIQTQIRMKDISDYPLKAVICLNESVQNSLHRHFEDRMQVKVADLFASAELGFCGLLYSCDEGKGYHLQEDHYLAEVIGFGNEEPIAGEGIMGELVITTLTVEGMPLLRYRTGQAVMRINEPCPCGRTLARFATPFGGI